MPKHELDSRISGRVAVVGVGDRQHGDDGAGPVVADLLSKMGFSNVIDSGASPELDTWKLRALRPGTVLFVDAADFGGKPGDVAILEAEELRADGFDTHRAPLKLTMSYLERELGCQCLLVAIQPKDVRQGSTMCEDVRDAAEAVARMLQPVLCGYESESGARVVHRRLR